MYFDYIIHMSTAIVRNKRKTRYINTNRQLNIKFCIFHKNTIDFQEKNGLKNH